MTDIYILGIACYYHDSSATLVKNGKIICAIEEERLTRKKHDNSFPHLSIDFCLKYAGISFNDLSDVAFYEDIPLKFQRFLTEHILATPHSFATFNESLPFWLNERLNLSEILKKKYKYDKDIKFVKHHVSHLSSAFYPSNFTESAYLTIDGVGEWESTTYGTASYERFKQLGHLDFPNSIGLFYSAMTSYLGFSVNDSEYKVMGLAAYGDKNPKTNSYYSRLKQSIHIKEDGSFILEKKCFNFLADDCMYTNELVKLLYLPPRKTKDPVTEEYKNLATAVQLITEEIIIKILNYIYEKTKTDNIVISGGVALNSVANGKILANTSFKRLFIQPASSDAGGSLGSALYTYYHGYPIKEQSSEKFNVYLGPSFTNEYISNFLDSHHIKYTKFETKKELLEKTAKLIYSNKVVGWFQGRMEWGPRALGSRSILANPCTQDMQNILNMKVKHREEFRPFAPAVCIEDAQTYFICDNPIPEPAKYMLMVYPVRESYRPLLPSITHVDGSGRLQTVEKDDNDLYYGLIKEFGKLSGIPILINTSFNIKGEPIVCTPKDAYYCMMSTEIDYLVIGSFLIDRNDNLDDEWQNNRGNYLFSN